MLKVQSDRHSTDITLRNNFTQNTSTFNLDDFRDHKPHNFSVSNEILKKSKELSYIHRYLLTAKPKRLRNRERIYDKGIEAFEFSSKDSDSEIFQPKIEINTEGKRYDTNKGKFIRIISLESSHNYETKSPPRAIKQSPNKYKNRARYFSNTRNRNNNLFDIRNFESFTMANINGLSLRKYDLSSIQIKNNFAIKKY